jgi:unsaturated rhamnogalacturonyl hydrolase
MRRFTLFLLLLTAISLRASAQDTKDGWSEKMARTVMSIWKDSLEMESGKPVKWAYDQGVVLEGMSNIWKRTGKGEYFKYVQKSMDFFVNKDGTIARYKQSDYNIDNLKNGRSLLLLYKTTQAEKYYKAAAHLREQLKEQPRTHQGGFWHKKVYPYQMWLDGLYMGQPFYAEYAAAFNEPEAFNDIANQFIYMEQQARDAKTGLLYHGWDESKKEQWADKETGLSPQFWGRAMGWYGMGLVDVLENFPDEHPQKKSLITILNRFAAAVSSVQDSSSGLWYQILDKPDGKGNYKEASASNMFVYAIAKGVRLGYLPVSYEAVAKKGYAGIIREFIETDANGQVNLKGTVSVAGLGGKPYRDGSYEYYLSEKVVTNDPKGVGAFLLASNEMELRDIVKAGAGKTILLDGYFNNESKKDITGKDIPWHYKWHELENGGFYLLGEHARYTGAKTLELKEAPTARNLRSADIYIIVDPDTEKENPHPNYVSKEHARTISKWVKKGGVLLLMANDEGNAELDHFNGLSKQFGMEFLKESKNKVTGSQFDMGKIMIPGGSVVFTKPYQLYLKEISTLKLSEPARSALRHNGDEVMAMSKFGKGTVFAVGDPWLYDEYTDGRKLPSSYQNFEAGNQLIRWLMNQVPAK